MERWEVDELRLGMTPVQLKTTSTKRTNAKERKPYAPIFSPEGSLDAGDAEFSQWVSFNMNLANSAPNSSLAERTRQSLQFHPDKVLLNTEPSRKMATGKGRHSTGSNEMKRVQQMHFQREKSASPFATQIGTKGKRKPTPKPLYVH